MQGGRSILRGAPAETGVPGDHEVGPLGARFPGWRVRFVLIPAKDSGAADRYGPVVRHAHVDPAEHGVGLDNDLVLFCPSLVQVEFDAAKDSERLAPLEILRFDAAARAAENRPFMKCVRSTRPGV